MSIFIPICLSVALRKESVDRNIIHKVNQLCKAGSLSARRAWIEIAGSLCGAGDPNGVALRKESVDRNYKERPGQKARPKSLSARRAWIEIVITAMTGQISVSSLSARRAWIEIC